MLERIIAQYFNFTEYSVKQLKEIYSTIRVINILSSLKKTGKRYYIRVNTLKVTREDVISLLKEEGIKAYPYKALKDVIYLKITGPYKLTRHKRIVIADKAAAESVYMGANLYGPGVLKTKNVHQGDIVSVYSPLGHLVAEGIAVMDGEEMVVKKRGLAVETLRSVYKVPHIRELNIYKKGHIHDQSLPSILSIYNLAPLRNWKIVDICAGPGGKTTLVAQMMKNTGHVLAVDRAKGKVKRIEEHCKRLGIKNVKTYVLDSRYLSEISDFADADAVILDPPCSALGVRPKLYYNRKIEEINALPKYQRQFIKEALNILKPGGILLYTTCTLTLEENEKNILWTLKNFSTKILSQKYFIGSPGISLINGLERTQRFEPDKHDVPGFYIALIQKIS